jgi:Uma2 family endonuclease
MSAMASGDPQPARPDVKLTYDDFVLFPDDGKRHELIDGEHYVTASPNLPHQGIVGNLYFFLRSHLETHPVGRVFTAPLDVVLSNVDVVEPDLLYVSHASAEILTTKHVRGAPELVVEVGSPSTRKRDETIKRGLYERWGVSEYWVVDPDLEGVHVYRLGEKRYERVADLSVEHGDDLTTPLLPGLSIPLARVFAL